MAETPAAKVPTSRVLTLAVTVDTGATLPAIITAALKVARLNSCNVSFTWGKQTVVVSADDTYQGVQRRVGRQGNG